MRLLILNYLNLESLPENLIGLIISVLMLEGICIGIIIPIKSREQANKPALIFYFLMNIIYRRR